jgi:hypothetical protein
LRLRTNRDDAPLAHTEQVSPFGPAGEQFPPCGQHRPGRARPAGIKITDNAIIPVKERSADQRYDPLGRVLRSWRTGRARQDGPAVIPG